MITYRLINILPSYIDQTICYHVEYYQYTMISVSFHLFLKYLHQSISVGIERASLVFILRDVTRFEEFSCRFVQ